MLARDYCDSSKRKEKPVIVSHHMLSGLKEGQAKMSKSDPDSAIFMEDSIEDVNRKIKKSFCPDMIVANNPILDYCKNIILPAFGTYAIQVKSLNLKKEYKSYDELEADFKVGTLHPGDLKPAVAEGINRLLQPVRDHFKNDAYARDLLTTIKGWNEEIAKKNAVPK